VQKNDSHINLTMSESTPILEECTEPEPDFNETECLASASGVEVLSWDDFINAIPRFRTDLMSGNLHVFLRNPSKETVIDEIVTTGYDGCCTSTGDRVRITAPQPVQVTHDGARGPALLLSDIIMETGAWSTGSRGNYDEPVEKDDMDDMLIMLCPYDIHTYNISKGTVLRPVYDFQDQTYADVMEELFTGDVLVTYDPYNCLLLESKLTTMNRAATLKMLENVTVTHKDACKLVLTGSQDMHVTATVELLKNITAMHEVARELVNTTFLHMEMLKSRILAHDARDKKS
jgi:hypothetical protein